MVQQLLVRYGGPQQQCDRPGAGLGRLQLDDFVLDHARLPGPLHLLSRRERTLPRLPLSVVDVRAVRWGQIQLLIRGILQSAHQLSKTRVTRFMKAARLDEALKSMLYRGRYSKRPFGSTSAWMLSRTKRRAGSFLAVTPRRLSP